MLEKPARITLLRTGRLSGFFTKTGKMSRQAGSLPAAAAAGTGWLDTCSSDG
jgi:hypothetical protein